MSIYTKTGDTGCTSLANGERVSKADERLEAYGTADELNAWVGMLRAALSADDDQTDMQLRWVQNKLFNLGASLSSAEGDWITASEHTMLERWIDQMQAELLPIRAFVLPMGNEQVARCHMCRTVTRRLERCIARADYKGIEEELRFVNRLSDYFFVLARWLGGRKSIEPEIWEK